MSSTEYIAQAIFIYLLFYYYDALYKSEPVSSRKNIACDLYKSFSLSVTRNPICDIKVTGNLPLGAQSSFSYSIFSVSEIRIRSLTYSCWHVKLVLNWSEAREA